MKYLASIKGNSLMKALATSILYIVSLNLAAGMPKSAQRYDFQTSQSIRQSAKIFLEKTALTADNPAIEVVIGKLDPRLRLRQCHQALDTKLLNKEKLRGKTTLVVSCASPVAWKVFISAKVLQYAEVVVAKRNINRLAIIGPQDVEIKRVEITNLRKRPITSLDRILGSTAKRHIRRDSVIFEHLSCLICKGDRVQISAQSRFFNIDLEAVALADAAIGETTLVRNIRSKRIFNAVVTGKNQLKVKL